MQTQPLLFEQNMKERQNDLNQQRETENIRIFDYTKKIL